LDQIFDWIIMRGKSSYQSGLLLVFGSAIVWSFGGALARFLTIEAALWRDF